MQDLTWSSMAPFFRQLREIDAPAVKAITVGLLRADNLGPTMSIITCFT